MEEYPTRIHNRVEYDVRAATGNQQVAVTISPRAKELCLPKQPFEAFFLLIFGNARKIGSQERRFREMIHLS